MYRLSSRLLVSNHLNKVARRRQKYPWITEVEGYSWRFLKRDMIKYFNQKNQVSERV